METGGGGTIFLRDAVVTELPFFAALETAPDTAPYILPHGIKEHEALMESDQIRYLAVCLEGVEKPVGFLILIVEENCLGLKRMVMGPKKRGYGSACLELLEVLCRNMGRRRIWLDVFADNLVARRLYERAGFCRQNEVDFFGRSLLIYEKELV